MEITVKRIGQPAKIINVTEMTTVAELLPQISSDSGVEGDRISLLFNGTPLSDKNRSLKDYSIKSGDRIVVVIKSGLAQDFEQVLQKYLQASYSADDARVIAKTFMSVLSRTLDSLSIDDIDRMANTFAKSS